jgi:hypothetical protein
MSTRSLTSKQQRFAELLAGGCTKVDAFRSAYPSERRGKGTEWEGAKRVARHPAVAAEVQRLTLLRSPHDVTAQADHIAARLLELSKSQEPAVALRAIAQWGKMAEAGLLNPPIVAGHRTEVSTQRVDKAQILEDLRRLYREGLEGKGQQRKELLGSTNAEPMQGTDCQILSDGAVLGELPAISMEEEPLRSLPESPTNQDAIGVVFLPEAREEPALQTEEYEWQYQPGFFGKPRRVRVRVR